MKLHIGTPRCLLVVAPHPDDETIGAYGLMLRLYRRRVRVQVLVVSDGGGSHAGSPTWAGRRLILERRRETRRAVRRAGVTAGAIAFLDLPDGALAADSEVTRRCVATALRRAPKPLLVAAPVPSDDHPDHRVVAAAVTSARMAGVRCITYPVWPTNGRLRRSRLLVLSVQERLSKRHAIRSYRTQTGRISDDPNGFAMTPAQVSAFSRPVEIFVESRR